MSKPVKELIQKELTKRLEGVDSLAVVGFTGLDAITTNIVRKRLMQKNIRMTVVKNSIARQAFKSIGIEAAADLLEGPCALAYGADSVVTVVRELLAAGKDAANLTVKAAYMEGTRFSQEQIDALSKYPNRDEAIALVVAAAVAPARKLAACLVGPGGKIASILKTLEEKAQAAAPAEAPAEAAAAAEAPAAEAAAPEAPAPAAE
ncbi:MAG: 50S ribosomal protein L10 [Phycisphaerae bacterium]|jgi:large subunit ribosomal protein L10